MARQGVGIVPPEERRQAIGMKRSASCERIEHDNAVLKRAHMQSVREHILELRAAQLASSERAAGSDSVDSVDSVATVETEGSGLLCRATDCGAAEQAWERASAGSSGCAATKVDVGCGGGEGCSGGGGDGGGGYSGVSPTEVWTSCLHYPLELNLYIVM